MFARDYVASEYAASSRPHIHWHNRCASLPVWSGLWCLLGRTLLGGDVICQFGIDVLPELDAAVDGVAVCAEDHVVRQVLHQLGVTAAQEHGIADHAGLKAGDDVQDGLSPTPDTPA